MSAGWYLNCLVQSTAEELEKKPFQHKSSKRCIDSTMGKFISAYFSPPLECSSSPVAVSVKKEPKRFVMSMVQCRSALLFLLAIQL